jgi:hypothetical protein
MKMAKINMMDATNILSEIRKKLDDKRQKRSEAAAHQSKEIEQFEKTSEVDDYTNEINTLRDHLVMLTELMSKANMRYKVTLPGIGKQVTLAAALTLVKEMRNEISCLQRLAKLPVEPKFNAGYRESYYEVATFDVARYDVLTKDMQKDATSLSRAIDRANEKAYFEFEFAESYLTL